METKEALIFGAGNIGRGFLADLLDQSGYHLTFVDVDTEKIKSINEEKRYPLITVSAGGRTERVISNISGIETTDSAKVKQAIREADIILTAVGKNALPDLAQHLVHGLVERVKCRPQDKLYTFVIACENVQDNSQYLKQLLAQKISHQEMKKIEKHVDFPTCVVDRIVPNAKLSEQNPLSVMVEEYFQFVIDAKAVRFSFPKIKGMDVSADVNAILEQKLFTLNMAHALAAYYGYLHGVTYIHQAMQEKNLFQLLQGALQEVCTIITDRNPSISIAQQQQYTEKILKRFQNPYLCDEVIRVARDPKRKLGKADRLIQPAVLYQEMGKTPAYLATGIASALHYDHPGDKQAQEVGLMIQEKGIESVLEQVSGLGRESVLTKMVRADYLLTGL